MLRLKNLKMETEAMELPGTGRSQTRLRDAILGMRGAKTAMESRGQWRSQTEFGNEENARIQGSCGDGHRPPLQLHCAGRSERIVRYPSTGSG